MGHLPGVAHLLHGPQSVAGAHHFLQAPVRSRQARTAGGTSVRGRTSAGAAVHAPPSEAMVPLVSSAAGRSRSTATTTAPSRANATAVALPLPQPGPQEPAPKTRATLS